MAKTRARPARRAKGAARDLTSFGLRDVQVDETDWMVLGDTHADEAVEQVRIGEAIGQEIAQRTLQFFNSPDLFQKRMG